VDYEPGSTQESDVRRVEAVSEEARGREYDPTGRITALKHCEKPRAAAVRDRDHLHRNRIATTSDATNLVDQPLATLPSSGPGAAGPEALEDIMEGCGERDRLLGDVIERIGDRGSPIAQSPIADSSPLALVLVRPDPILRRRDRIVRESVGVDPFAVWIAGLLIRGPIAFDRTLVAIRIG
jgi:hypothetical protein